MSALYAACRFDMEGRHITGNPFHPEWTYTIEPPRVREMQRLSLCASKRTGTGRSGDLLRTLSNEVASTPRIGLGDER
jgi:hypothetical protein